MKYYYDTLVNNEQLIKTFALIISIVLTIVFHVWTITGSFNVMHESNAKNIELVNKVSKLEDTLRGKDLVIKSAFDEIKTKDGE